ncbi:MAG TPA: YlxR family protein [Dehalococcoidia bacterium]
MACRATTAKRELVRVVRTPEGRVELDPTGKRPGRGAYVHNSRECWQQALARDRLSATLRTKLRPEDRAALEAYAARLPSEAP